MRKNSLSIILAMAALFMTGIATTFAAEKEPRLSISEDFTAHWASMLPDSTRLCDLSIPTSHDATTWDAFSDFWRDQQWDARTLFRFGVRAFDLRLSKSDHYRHGSKGFANNMKSYEEEQREHLPTMDQLKGEFMILFVQWEDYDNDPQETRKKGFNKWIEDVISNKTNGYPKDSFVVYKKGLTLGDIRNKILVINREGAVFNPDSIKKDEYRIPTAWSDGNYICKTQDGKPSNASDDVREPFKVVGNYELEKQKKKKEVVELFDSWFTNYFENHVNKTGTYNYIMLNSYYKRIPAWWHFILPFGDSLFQLQNGGEICSDDTQLNDWLNGTHIDQGVNHVTYDYLEDMHDPYGFVQFDFIGEKTNDRDPCYGDKLLERVVLNNFHGSLAKGMYIDDIALCIGATKETAENTLVTKGYNVIDLYETQLESKDYKPVYLGYKLTENKSDAISNIILYRSEDANNIPEEITDAEGRIYKPLAHFVADDLKLTWDGNINMQQVFNHQGNGLYLYCTNISEGPEKSRYILKGLQMSLDKESKNDSITMTLCKKTDNGFEFAENADFNDNKEGLAPLYMHMAVHEHQYTQNYSDTTHYEFCTGCGIKRNAVAHDMSIITKCDGYEHLVKCSGCNYETYNACIADSYDEDGFGICKVCDTICGQPAPIFDSDSCTISNPGQLYWFASQINYHGKQYSATLLKDIVITDEIQSKSPWTPIGTFEKAYKKYLDENGDIHYTNENSEMTYTPTEEMFGTGYGSIFNGQGHTISGIKYDGGSKRPGHGVFGYINSGIILNLGIVNSSFKGYDYTGSFAGKVYDAILQNVYSTADVDNDADENKSYYGGIAGCFTYTDVINGYFKGNMKNQNSSAVYALGQCTDTESSAENFFALYANEKDAVPTVITEEQFKDGTLLEKLNAKVNEYNDGAQSKILVAWQQTIGQDATPFFENEDKTAVSKVVGNSTGVQRDGKYIYKRQLVILKNGKLYNAYGQMIK